MTDVTQGEASPSTKIMVPVTKSKGFVEIDTRELPDDVYAEVLLQGLKVLVNRGMSKITTAGLKDKALDDAKAAAQAKAEENVEAIKTGKIKFTGKAKAKKASGVVMTEARRIARNMVKDALKAEGIKISHVDAKEITAAANALIEDNPDLIKMAEANLAEREKAPIKINIAGIPISEKKVKAAEAKKAKDTLSATQAGKAKPRAKGQQPTA